MRIYGKLQTFGSEKLNEREDDNSLNHDGGNNNRSEMLGSQPGRVEERDIPKNWCQGPEEQIPVAWKGVGGTKGKVVCFGGQGAVPGGAPTGQKLDGCTERKSKKPMVGPIREDWCRRTRMEKRQSQGDGG